MGDQKVMSSLRNKIGSALSRSSRDPEPHQIAGALPPQLPPAGSFLGWDQTLSSVPRQPTFPHITPPGPHTPVPVVSQQPPPYGNPLPLLPGSPPQQQNIPNNQNSQFQRLSSPTPQQHQQPGPPLPPQPFPQQHQQQGQQQGQPQSPPAPAATSGPLSGPVNVGTGDSQNSYFRSASSGSSVIMAPDRKLERQEHKHYKQLLKERQRDDARIAKHFSKADPTSFDRSSDHVKQLVEWATGKWKSANEARHKLEKLELADRQATETADLLATQVENMSVDLGEKKSEIKALQLECEEQKKARQGAEDDLAATVEANAKEKRTWEGQLRIQLQEQWKVHQAQILGINADHREEMEELKAAIDDLRAEMISEPGDEFKQTMDTELQMRARGIKKLVDQVTDPMNLGGGDGSARSWAVRRHNLWKIIVEGFFGIPYGFGAFGQDGHGQQLLWGVYQAYMKLKDGVGTIGQVSLVNPQLDIFSHDPQANRWRAITFESIGKMVHTQPSSAMSKAYVQNRNEVEGLLLDALYNASGGLEIKAEIKTHVSEIARSSANLALVLACQRARSYFALPSAGTEVSTSDFRDCSHPETPVSWVTVEICVTPAVFKRGDGREDLNTHTVIASGDVFPMSPQAQLNNIPSSSMSSAPRSNSMLDPMGLETTNNRRASMMDTPMDARIGGPPSYYAPRYHNNHHR